VVSSGTQDATEDWYLSGGVIDSHFSSEGILARKVPPSGTPFILPIFVAQPLRVFRTEASPFVKLLGFPFTFQRLYPIFLGESFFRGFLLAPSITGVFQPFSHDLFSFPALSRAGRFGDV